MRTDLEITLSGMQSKAVPGAFLLGVRNECLGWAECVPHETYREVLGSLATAHERAADGTIHVPTQFAEVLRDHLSRASNEGNQSERRAAGARWLRDHLIRAGAITHNVAEIDDDVKGGRSLEARLQSFKIAVNVA